MTRITASLVRSLLLGTLLLLGSGGVSAQDVVDSTDSASVHPEARTAIGRLWSPYCPGMMLEVCPSPGGEMLRDSIGRMARRGLEADSIVEVILADYGEEYRAQPRTDGVGRLAWYIPPAGLLAGMVVVGTFLARRRGRGPVGTSTITAEDEERLRTAMARLDAEERPDF